jgi:hypothetical protein
MSLAAVAQAAGTTRRALYRRWPSKADLTVAVTMCTGSWYGRGLAAEAVPPN